MADTGLIKVKKWVRDLADGTSCYYYEVAYTAMDHEPGLQDILAAYEAAGNCYMDSEAVVGTEAECKRWEAARRTLLRRLDRASRIERAALRLGGPSAALTWATTWSSRRGKRAARAYRPIHAEVRQRLAPYEAAIRERKERCHAAAEKTVWGWVVTNSATVYLYRHDVPADIPLPESDRRSQEPLSAKSLWQTLAPLSATGVTTVEWDTAACRALEEECSTSSHRVSFRYWWREAGHGAWWLDPTRLPRAHTEPSGTPSSPRSSSPSIGSWPTSPPGTGGHPGGFGTF
ncbi:hypothetical protein AB0L59_41165 [Streptomyces sp. NPDC052109]|uniref:hypothetical protein n=1 Tax=Streptomyces sp. NPDC052109 TaxID=3155527 RepID=UPI00343C57DD